MLLVGSLRKAPINRQLARASIKSPPTDFTFKPFERIDELRYYDEDLGSRPRAEPIAALRAAATRADALLVVTPQYNGTTPGGLKNVIDWLSRTYGHGPVRDKPAAVIGASLGRHGGSGAREDTRKSLAIAGPRDLSAAARP